MDADRRHRRPGSFTHERRCASSPMARIAVRIASRFGAKSSRSNGSNWPSNALAYVIYPKSGDKVLLIDSPRGSHQEAPAGDDARETSDADNQHHTKSVWSFPVQTVAGTHAYIFRSQLYSISYLVRWGR